MALSLLAAKVTIDQAGIAELARGRLSPVGRDLEGRALRVTQRMKANAQGRPGPEVRTATLVSAISILLAGEDAQGLVYRIGPQPGRVTKRGYNYAAVLEGLIPRGGAPPDGAYPFMERSLDAAR